MTHIGWFIATWFLFFTGGLLYVLGVYIGKRYERRVLTAEFQSIFVKLLHFAAKEDYIQLHGLLQELVVDKDTLDAIRHESEAVEEPAEVLERMMRVRDTPRKPSDAPKETED